ncbi:MAG: hypothetical protein HOW73_27300 [Polyangiaceae bacterium]|nr:hypothetical protein [Polyangiaceae bacterium]
MKNARLGLALSLLVVAACKEDVDKLDPRAVETGKKVVEYLVDKADDESSAHDKQIRNLDGKIKEVQKAIESGDLDTAEAKLVDIRWKPSHPGMLPEGEKELIKQYDESRESLSALIKRKRGA